MKSLKEVSVQDLRRIDVTTKKQDVRDVIAAMDRGEYKLSEMQREFTYDNVQLSYVIVSILSGMPIDTVSLVQLDKDGCAFAICDGQHRLYALKEFVSGAFPLYVKTNVKPVVRSMLHGKLFGELPKSFQNEILSRQLDITVVKPQVYTEKELRSVQADIFTLKNSCAVGMDKKQLQFAREAIKRPEILAQFKQFAQEAYRGTALKGYDRTHIGRYLNGSILRWSALFIVKQGGYFSRERCAEYFARTSDPGKNRALFARYLVLGLLYSEFDVGVTPEDFVRRTTARLSFVRDQTARRYFFAMLEAFPDALDKQKKQSA